MIIKKEGFDKSHLSYFDLLVEGERALAKAFAYTIANEPDALFKFLRILGINEKKSKQKTKDIKISIENKYNVDKKVKGVTDIEIKLNGKFHIIIETKINENRVKEQKDKYLELFENEKNKNIMCFLAHEKYSFPPYKTINNKEINIISITWTEIIDNFEYVLRNVEKRKKKYHSVLKDFLDFVLRRYKMSVIKEILVQDVSDEEEIKRIIDYNVYRRDETYGVPLYFAPYFTKKAKNSSYFKNKVKNFSEGISYIFKVLGVLTINPNDIGSYEDSLKQFAEGQENKEDIMENWKEGVKIRKNDNKIFTFYFLGDKTELTHPLLKDGDWLPNQIPKNKEIKFSIIMEKIKESYKNNKQLNK